MVRERLTSMVALVLAFVLLAAACSANRNEAADDGGSVLSSKAVDDTPSSSATSATSSSTTSTTIPTTTIPTTTTTRPEPEAETDPEVLAQFVTEHNGDFGLEDADLTIRNRGPGENKAGFPPEAFVDESAWVVFTALGLIGADVDPETVGQHRIGTIRGMCCPVAMWDNDDHPLMRSVVVVHELTHLADVEREYFDQLDEERFATVEREQVSLLAVPAEGNASRVHQLYQDQLVANGARPERFDAKWDAPGIPDVMVRVWEFAYRDGQAFMQALVDRGGQDAVEEAFDRPPISSEQVYDVDAYLGAETPLDVSPPEAPADAEVLNSRATLGSFVIQILAEQSMTPAEARTLATSWSGDAATVYEVDGQRCIAATMVMDDAAAAGQLVAVLRAASIEAAIDDNGSDGVGDTVELGRCAPWPDLS